jgi:hypothetical protein
MYSVGCSTKFAATLMRELKVQYYERGFRKTW